LPGRAARGDTALAIRSCAARQQKKGGRDHHHRGIQVSSFSYLPQTFATLFVLAASLLLGLIR